ncbi:hypothetical protein GCM10011578_031680 [Streptomyces fuscichromogenes]|uniref:Transposase n=1 Tax=Streptomyces fuscichromogenes TaxID=1324013 RepID=A0A917XBV3_9ACTN|nr:hypothetical protein GCM10011578_031680 [Streptomyces fuscichromogenes]
MSPKEGDSLDSRGSLLPPATLDTTNSPLTSWHWMFDAMRSLVDNGVTWTAIPVDFP